MFLGISIIVCVEFVFLGFEADFYQGFFREAIGFVISNIVCFIVYYYIKVNFQNVIEVEKLENDVFVSEKTISTPERKETKGIAYAGIATSTLGCILILIIFFYSMIGISNIETTNSYLLITDQEIKILIVSMISIVSLFILKQLNEHVIIKKLLSVITLFTGYGSMCLFVLLIKGGIEFDQLNLSNYFALFMIIGTPILVSKGFYSNNVLIHGYPQNRFLRILGIFIGVGCCSVLTVLIYPSVLTIGITENDALKMIFMSILLIVVSFIIIPVFVTRLFWTKKNSESNGDDQITLTEPIGGVAQDGFLIATIILLACLFPVFFNYFVEDYESLLGYITIAFVLSNPLNYCLDNNIGHLSRQKERIVKYPKYSNTLRIQYDALTKHIKTQNFMVLFMILPYSIIAIMIRVKNKVLG